MPQEKAYNLIGFTFIFKELLLPEFFWYFSIQFIFILINSRGCTNSLLRKNKSMIALSLQQGLNSTSCPYFTVPFFAYFQRVLRPSLSQRSYNYPFQVRFLIRELYGTRILFLKAEKTKPITYLNRFYLRRSANHTC